MMEIVKCYKILELKNGASMNDAKQAYKDMVRVWHPDRFAGNPRLRAKADEKLKEINFAYGEIHNLLLKDFAEVPNAAKTKGTKSLFTVEFNLSFLKRIIFFVCSHIYSFIMNVNLKQVYREVMFSKINFGKIPSENGEQQSIKSQRDTTMRGKAQVKHKHFSEVLKEVAKTKKRTKGRYAGKE